MAKGWELARWLATANSRFVPGFGQRDGGAKCAGLGGVARELLCIGAMKTLFRLFFGKRRTASAETPLFRFYLNEFNSPHHARHSDTVRL